MGNIDDGVLNMKPIYSPLENITYDEALRILETGTISERILLPLRAGETMVDWKQAQTVCIKSFESEDLRVRANAALGLAYIARTKGQLEKHLVKPLLVKELRENIENRWRIIDAITDINFYLGWHLEEKALGKIKAEQEGN